MAYAPDGLRMTPLRIPGVFTLWLYSTTDALATVNSAGYIADAESRGMRVNDVVLVRKTDTFALSFMTVNAISSGAADLTDGLDIGTTDSD